MPGNWADEHHTGFAGLGYRMLPADYADLRSFLAGKAGSKHLYYRRTISNDDVYTGLNLLGLMLVLMRLGIPSTTSLVERRSRVG